MYTGKVIELDNRYSQLIAMIWVIMMFGVAIPVLYVAGFLLCFVTYWTDKTLYLKFYKLPPKHGSALSHKARNIIEWSLLCHVFMGLYMLSNPEIFTTEDDDNQAVGFFAGIAKFVSLGISALTGVNSSRFGQVHTVVYAFFVFIFIALFIMEKVSGTWSRIMGKVCCCCLYKGDDGDAFSDDLFCVISPEAQRKEFAEAKRTLAKVADSIKKDPHNEFIDLRRYYWNRLRLKVEAMRYHLYCAGSLAGLKKDDFMNERAAW